MPTQLTPEQRASMQAHMKAGKTPREAMACCMAEGGKVSVEVGEPKIERTTSVEVGKPVMEPAKPSPRVEVGEPVIESAKKPPMAVAHLAQGTGDVQPVAAAEAAKAGAPPPQKPFDLNAAATKAHADAAAKAAQEAAVPTPEQLALAKESATNPMAYLKYTHATQGDGLAMNPVGTPKNPAGGASPSASAPVAPVAPAPKMDPKVLLAKFRNHLATKGKATLQGAAPAPGQLAPSVAPPMPSPSAPVAEDVPKYAHGGTVNEPEPNPIYSHIADRLSQHVQKFAEGTGDVMGEAAGEAPQGQSPEGAVAPRPQHEVREFPHHTGNEHEPDFSGMKRPEEKHESIELGQPTLGNQPKPGIDFSHMEEPKEIYGAVVGEPKIEAPPKAEAAGYAAPRGGVGERTHKPLGDLDEIEAERVAANKDAGPSVLQRIGRAISGAGNGFAGRAQIDFQAGDRAKVAANNAEADRLKKNYIGRPGEQLEHDSGVTGSKVSLNRQKLVDNFLGQPGATAGMSAAESKQVEGLMAQSLKLKQEGKLMEAKAIQDQIQNQFRERAQNTADNNTAVRKQGIEQSHEDNVANRQAANTRVGISTQDSGRGDTGYQKAGDAIRRIGTMQDFLNRPANHPVTVREFETFSGELANAINGGPDQELAKKLSELNASGQVAKMKEYLTGHPEDAHVQQQLKQVYAPYVAKLLAASRGYQAEHMNRVSEPLNAAGPGFFTPSFQASLKNPNAPTEAGAAANPIGAQPGAPKKDALDEFPPQ